MWRHSDPKRADAVCVRVNGLPYDEYFQGPEQRQMLLAPMLMASSTLADYGVEVEVHGGGVSSQVRGRVPTGKGSSCMRFCM